jgi:hypothetical protein
VKYPVDTRDADLEDFARQIDWLRAKIELLEKAHRGLPPERVYAILGAVISGLDEFGDAAPFASVRMYLLEGELRPEGIQ